MNLRLTLGLVLLLASAFAFADSPRSARPPISKETRMDLIRLMNAEYAWVKLTLPHSQKGLKIHPDGSMDPHGRDLQVDVAKFGPIARPGERVQITNIDIRDKNIILELNGGAIKKAKWYQRISVSAGAGEAPVAPGPDNSRAQGTSITVEFKNHVPEMTLAELKQILTPLLDFTVKSAAQAYTESLPKNVQDAIKEHRVLVGMNKEMVTYSKGRPPQRVREKDDKGQEYEEWIYGQPPRDVEFVRFTGEEVTQLKIMRVGGERIVKTEREVKLDGPNVAKEEEQRPGPKPANAPTLRRPGEATPADTSNVDYSGRSVDMGTGSQPQGTNAPPTNRPAPPDTPAGVPVPKL
jgi:hypothetical protein